FSLFFFSSRRRHTRFSRDWSSDVCSSDLIPATAGIDHTGVVTKPSHVYAEHNRADLRLNLPFQCRHRIFIRDEALSINPRKFPLNANANKVRVLAVVLNPPLNLLLVRERNAAGVDLNRIP